MNADAHGHAEIVSVQVFLSTKRESPHVEGGLPERQIFHAAEPSAGGWTIMAVHGLQGELGAACEDTGARQQDSSRGFGLSARLAAGRAVQVYFEYGCRDQFEALRLMKIGSIRACRSQPSSDFGRPRRRDGGEGEQRSRDEPGCDGMPHDRNTA
jgi:hypothetical protein